MTQDAEQKAKRFYENEGWDSNAEGATLDAQLWEDLRPCATNYISECRKKLLTHLPAQGGEFVDAASGPVQYPEYVDYSRGFQKRVCIDLSEKALKEAKRKLGDHAETLCVSILDLDIKNRFDAGVSLHTIYHIDKNLQEKAVRKLLDAMKPGAPLIVVYSNPRRLLSRIKRWFVKNTPEVNPDAALYFYSYPLSWWKTFQDQADVQILPWRFWNAVDAQLLIPGNFIGKMIYSLTLIFEKWFPRIAAELGAYPMIILTRRS